MRARGGWASPAKRDGVCCPSPKDLRVFLRLFSKLVSTEPERRERAPGDRCAGHCMHSYRIFLISCSSEPCRLVCLFFLLENNNMKPEKETWWRRGAVQPAVRRGCSQGTKGRPCDRTASPQSTLGPCRAGCPVVCRL